MAKEVAADDAAHAYANSASLTAVALEGSISGLITETVLARASAPVLAAEVAEGAQLDLMV